MLNQKKGQRILSIVLFVIGVGIGLALAGSTIWANLEASLFNADMPGDGKLALHCPALITRSETGVIRAKFTNIATWDVNLSVTAHISQDSISYYREEITRLPLAPGESQEVRWEVNADKLVYGHFIFIKVANQRLTPIEGRIGTCGILVVDLPGESGTLILVISIALSLLLMGSGYFLWAKLNRTVAFGPALDAQRAMTGLLIVVTAAVVCGILRAWLPGIVVMVIAFFLVIEVTRHFLQKD